MRPDGLKVKRHIARVRADFTVAHRRGLLGLTNDAQNLTVGTRLAVFPNVTLVAGFDQRFDDLVAIHKAANLLGCQVTDIHVNVNPCRVVLRLGGNFLHKSFQPLRVEGMQNRGHKLTAVTIIPVAVLQFVIGNADLALVRVGPVGVRCVAGGLVAINLRVVVLLAVLLLILLPVCALQ